MSAKEYAGKQVVIAYDAQRCIHAAECSRGLRAVFDPEARPWIRPDRADPAAITAVISRCPTGALTLRNADGSNPEVADARNSVSPAPDGPLYLRGRIAFAGSAAEQPPATRVALCRCGASRNKPYCDRSHVAAQFRDAGACGRLPDDATPGAPTGTVTVKPIANGPLMLQGWFELKTSDGAVFVAGEKTWLCRCGQSSNKPFCDGTHKKVGFQG
jgi:CDGSH-type Zn-finger protein/uncharacterized Fe-S cluster protein YjdI